MIINSSKYFLDLDTTLFNVYDILENENKDHIIIVIPTDCSLFDGQINFDIIKSFCDDLKKILLIVTEDEKGLKMIQRSGLVGVKKMSQVTVDLWQVAEQRVYQIKKNILESTVNDKKDNQIEVHEEVIDHKNDKNKLSDIDDIGNDTSNNLDEDIVFYVGKDVKHLLDKSNVDKNKNISIPVIAADYSKLLLKNNRGGISFSFIFIIRKILSNIFLFKKNIFLYFVILCILTISVGIFVTRFLIISEVSINTEREDIVNEFKVILSENLTDNEDLYTPEGVISSIFIDKVDSVSISKTFNISKKTQTGKKAVGLISLYNLTDKDIKLPAGTKVQSLIQGKQYVLTKEIIVPKVSQNSFGEKIPQSVEDVPIEALDYGEVYNLPISQGDDNFKILLDGLDDVSKASGRIFRDIKGGESFEVFKVLQSDVEGVMNDLQEELKTITREKLLNRVIKTDIALVDHISYTITETKIVPNIGEDSLDGFFTISLTMNGELPKIPKVKLNDLAKFYFSNVSEKQLNVQNLELQVVNVIYDKQKSAYYLTVGLSANLKSKISQDYIFDLIKGKYVEDARDILIKDENISSVNILFKPGFVPEFMQYIPIDKDRVQIRIN